MQRRNFIKSLSASLSIASIPKIFPMPFIETKISWGIIKPPRLSERDTVGLVSPAGFITPNELEEARKNLQSLGLNVTTGENILLKFGYLAGTDKQRAADLNQMFADENVKGIFAARGGYGCARILNYLDFDLIKKNPKILVGYSDITALIYAIFSKTGLVSFHGPVGISTFNEFSTNYIKEVLFKSGGSVTLWNANEDNSNAEYKVTTIRSGKAKGRLAGGNLSIVVSMIGTEYDIDTAGKIIFLEEIGEEPYRIDRMLTQMIHAGKFKNAAGIALGVFRKCEPKESESGIGNSFSFSEVLFDRLFNLGIPVIYGMSFGHIANKFTLPVGIEAELDVDNQTLTLLEPAVG